MAARHTRRAASEVARLVDRLAIETSPAGVVRIALAPRAGGRPPDDRLARRARAEIRQYLAGGRAAFTVPLDLGGVGPFRRRVLEATRRVPFGAIISYAALARRVGRPGAARAVGNAVAANPLPLLVPCHRIVRSDGTWGPYALGPAVKTALLALEQREARRLHARARRVLGAWPRLRC